MEKICEYLNEIGILDYENINAFLNIYSTLNNQKYSNEIDKIIDTLKIYLINNFIKNNLTSKLCENIISSYNNFQLISKYQSLNNMNNILLTKIRNKYMMFFLNLSLFLLKKKKRTKIVKQRNLGRKSKNKKNISKYDDNDEEINLDMNDDNNELISSDDERECTFTPQINKTFKGYKNNNFNNNIKSHIYYSPAFNISSKFPLKNYQNNIYSNQSIPDNNMNNYSYSNNLNISNDNRSNMSYNQYGNNFNQYPEQQYNNEYNINNNRNYYTGNNFGNKIINQPNYNNMSVNNQFPYNKFNYSNISDNVQNNSDLFFNKELFFIQKVKDKIENLKIEELNKIKQECPFKPKINTNYKSFYPSKEVKEKEKSTDIKEKGQTIQLKNQKNLESIKEGENKEKIKKEKRKRAYSEKKKGIKIIEDLSLARKKRTEKTKRLMKEKNFTPKITKNDKYKVTMSFEDRRLKSIELRNKYKKAKKPENDEIKNNVESILAPGEMVRFKEINSDQNNNINEYNNTDNIYSKNNEENDKKDDLKNLDKKIESDEIKVIDNKNQLEENNINISNNFFQESNNKSEQNNLNLENKKSEIEKNKLFLMDKIKGEHKIGFKFQKDENKREINLTEENSESVSKIDLDMSNKKDEFSLQNFEAKSQGLKNMFKKSDE